MFSFKELLRITDGQARSLKKDFKVLGISTDTRQMKKDEIFIALKGKNFNGAEFINDARARGAAGAILSEDIDYGVDFPIIKVKNTKKALGEIASVYRDRFKIPVIAVTGSNGKTTTKEMIASVLSRRYKVLKTKENENNDIGVPTTLLRLKDEDIAVIEIGTNSFGEIRYNAEILKPTMAIITNIGQSHLEGLRDKEGVLIEKIALLESLAKKGIWVKNGDDEMLAKMPEVLRGKVSDTLSVISYGTDEERIDFKADNISYDGYETRFNLKVSDAFLGKVPNSAAFNIPLPGLHNVYNALAAIACCSNFVDIKTTIEVLASFKGPHMRMEIFNAGGFTIINDAYNCNPTSLKYAVSVLKKSPASGKKIAIIADMLELGEDSARLHYEAGRLFAQNSVDYLITYGENSFEMARGAIDAGMNKSKVISFREKDKLADFLRSIAGEGDVILIKGSRGMKMEEVVNCFITCFTR